MTDCFGTPTTYVETDTAIISATPYTAYPATWIFNSDNGWTSRSYTYPEVTVTIFSAKEEITLV